jgi:hypothetical protein
MLRRYKEEAVTDEFAVRGLVGGWSGSLGLIAVVHVVGVG